jgi:hypothetical protein
MSLSYSILSNAKLTFSFVEPKPFHWCFVCPLSVAEDVSGRYFLIAVEVRPGQVGSWLFSTAFNRVVFGGLKRHWWRNFLRDVFDKIACTLYAVCVDSEFGLRCRVMDSDGGL